MSVRGPGSPGALPFQAGAGRVLITGAGGLLGSALSREARRRGMATLSLSREDLDITDPEAVQSAVAGRKPHVVFNCAAYSQVDRAEDYPREALAVNRDGAGIMAEAASRAGAVMVHISTDYVFDGHQRRPYRPSDRPSPLSHYGISKLAGEMAVRDSGADFLVVRTSWLFGEGSGGFVSFIQGALTPGADSAPLRIVEDETSRPTWVEDLAPALLDLVARGGRGILHLANRGSCSRMGLAREASRLLGGKRELVGVTSEDFGAPARRPLYSVLDLTDAEVVLGRALPTWQDALRRYLVP